MVLAVLAAVFLGGGVRSTFALFNAVTQNTTTEFGTGWIGSPTSATATPSGNDADLAWTPGSDGPGTPTPGQTLFGVDNGTSSNCTGAAYATVTSSLASTASTYTDVNRVPTTTNGDWECYELESTSGTAWTGSTALTAVQVGLATSGLATTGGTGKISSNDTIVLTFNQDPDIAANTGTFVVCAVTSGATIVLGDRTKTTCSSAASTDTSSLGKITTSGSISASASSTTSTVAVSASAPWTVTITLKGMSATPTISGTLTYTPPTPPISSLTTALSTSGNTTSLKVGALPGPVGSGDSILVDALSGTCAGDAEIFAASAAAASGATSISVTSKAANCAYPAATTSVVTDRTIAIQNQVTTVSTALSTSGAITSISVAALTGAIPSGDQILLVSGTNAQIFTTSAAAAIGATSISVTSKTPNFAYPVGTSVTDLTDLASVCTAAATTCQPTASSNL